VKNVVQTGNVQEVFKNINNDLIPIVFLCLCFSWALCFSFSIYSAAQSQLPTICELNYLNFICVIYKYSAHRSMVFNQILCNWG
jgi:hypothetical protein